MNRETSKVSWRVLALEYLRSNHITYGPCQEERGSANGLLSLPGDIASQQRHEKNSRTPEGECAPVGEQETNPSRMRNWNGFFMLVASDRSLGNIIYPLIQPSQLC